MSNNSKFALDSISLNEEQPVDLKPQLQQREAHLIKVIEAIRGVSKSVEWSTLKTEIFDSLVNVLEDQIKNEAKKENPDSLKLNRLAGQLKWAEKYADLNKLENVFRVELSGLKIKLHGESNG